MTAWPSLLILRLRLAGRGAVLKPEAEADMPLLETLLWELDANTIPSVTIE